MRLLALLLFALPAFAVEAPLGNLARAGVPVLLRSEEPVVVDLEGWRYRVEGPTLVSAPRVPCVVRDEAGAELLRLEAVTGVLVGFDSAVPPGLDLGAGVRALPGVDLRGIPARYWPALDVFDRLVATRPDEARELLDVWQRGGGTVVADGTADLPVKPHPIPRVGASRADLYDLILPPAAESRAHGTALLIVLGASAAMAVLLLIGRRLLLTLTAVVLIAGVVGLMRTADEYRPLARGIVEVAWELGDHERIRTYRVFRYAGPGGTVEPEPEWRPVPYRPAGKPWGSEPLAGAWAIRVYVSETVRPLAIGLGGGQVDAATASLTLKKFWRRERPLEGAWRARIDPEPRPPVAGPGDPPLLVSLRMAPQD